MRSRVAVSAKTGAGRAARPRPFAAHPPISAHERGEPHGPGGSWGSLVHFLGGLGAEGPAGGLLPLPPPDGFPVWLGPLGGLGFPPPAMPHLLLKSKGMSEQCGLAFKIQAEAECRLAALAKPDGSARGARPLRSPRLAPPPKTAGGGWCCRTIQALRTRSGCAGGSPSPRPPPLANCARRGGEFDRVSAGSIRVRLSDTRRAFGARHLSPAQFAGERPGEGGAHRPAPVPAEAHRTQPHTQPPPAVSGEVRA